MYLGRPEHWKNTIRRFIHGKKICKNCWRFPFACLHMDPEDREMINKAFREGTIPRIKLPPRNTNES